MPRCNVYKMHQDNNKKKNKRFNHENYLHLEYLNERIYLNRFHSFIYSGIKVVWKEFLQNKAFVRQENYFSPIS